MSDYKDIENLWKQRNLEDIENGITPPTVTPNDISSKTAKIQNLDKNKAQKQISSQMIYQIINQKFEGISIPSEQVDRIVALVNDEGISFDSLDSFVENQLSDFLKQQELEVEETYQPLKLEYATVDKERFRRKIKRK